MKKLKTFWLTTTIILISLFGWAQQPETLTYRNVDGVQLTMYIIKPDIQAKSHAALVLFHGGGWNMGKPQALFKQAQYFAKRGLVVFLPQYRLRKINHTTIVEAVIDAKNAMAWVREHAEEYGVDPSKIIAGGGSAGGHLAAMTAMDTVVKAGLDYAKYRPDCLTLFNPVLDVGKEGYGHYKVAEEVEKYGLTWQDMSPIDKIRPGLPPTLIMVGDHDKVLPKPTAKKFEKLMKKAGNDCVVKIYPGGEHTFFNFGYAKKMGYPKGTHNRYYYETLQDMDDFLYNHGYLDQRHAVEIPADAIYPLRK